MRRSFACPLSYALWPETCSHPTRRHRTCAYTAAAGIYRTMGDEPVLRISTPPKGLGASS